MSKSAMLRTRRRDVNVKPNRRLDRKSSRGMIYENEELRLRTININAEIERGQSDIKKLRRENEQLRKEIWCLRDEYEKLDKLLKEKDHGTSCSSCTSDSDSSSSCTESEENETTQNIENVQKTTTLNNLRTEFDHLSVVTEETSAENSDKNSNSAVSSKENAWDIIPPDQSYPNSQTLNSSKTTLPVDQMPKHFFSPLKSSKSCENCAENENLCASSWSLGGNTSLTWTQFHNSQSSFVNFNQNFGNSPQMTPVKPTSATPVSSLPHNSIPLGHNPPSLGHSLSSLSHNSTFLGQSPPALAHNPIPVIHNSPSLPRNQTSAPNNSMSLSHDSTSLSYDPTSLSHNQTSIPRSQAFLSHNQVSSQMSTVRNNSSIYQPVRSDLQPCSKTSTDILMKTESSNFPNFSQESSTNSFVNGGNLDELLQDIETISKDILQISAQNYPDVNTNQTGISSEKLANGHDLKVDNLLPVAENNDIFTENKVSADGRPYKSELSVVLMPKPMPLLGFDKYQNIKSSLESIEALKKSTENLPVLELPPIETEELIIPEKSPQSFTPQPFPTELLSFTPTPLPEEPTPMPEITRRPSNPFFYGSFDSYHPENFTNRFKPDVFAHDNYGFKNDVLGQQNKLDEKYQEKCANLKNKVETETSDSTKTTNVDTEARSDKEQKDEKCENDRNDHKKDQKREEMQSPKSKRTRKVSIYFKGKKDKLARSLSLDTKMMEDTAKFNKSPLAEKKSYEDRKGSIAIPKTSGLESKISAYETNTTAQLKLQESEKILNSDKHTSSDSKNSANNDRKHRKSSSTSPERKHVHVKLEDGKKCHKKRHRKSERRLPNRRSSLSVDRLRERSFSVCTDRSNILDHRFGHSDDYTNSERDRSNSLSSCDTVKSRKMSTMPQFQVSGKIPWFGCWGNGCL